MFVLGASSRSTPLRWREALASTRAPWHARSGRRDRWSRICAAVAGLGAAIRRTPHRPARDGRGEPGALPMSLHRTSVSHVRDDPNYMLVLMKYFRHGYTQISTDVPVRTPWSCLSREPSVDICVHPWRKITLEQILAVGRSVCERPAGCGLIGNGQGRARP